MTRKDYILIAEALRRTADYTPGVIFALETGMPAAAFAIADALQTDDPRFDREHFLAVVKGEKALTSRP